MTKMIFMMSLLPMAWGNSYSYSYSSGPPAPAPAAPGAPAAGGGACVKGGWKCDKKWDPDHKAGFPDALEFTMWANVYRCMHDAAFIHHDATLSAATKAWFDSKTASSGHAPQSERPDQGENMWYAMPASSATPAKANAWWYDEVKHCTGSLPGCSSGKYQASHFTAMVWHDATKLGCWKNAKGLNVCRYKGGCGNCKQPNWAYTGAKCYEKNVAKVVKTKEKCMKEVKECFGKPIPHADRLYSDQFVEGMENIAGPWTFFVAFAAFAAFVGLGAFRMRKWAGATKDLKMISTIEADEELCTNE